MEIDVVADAGAVLYGESVPLLSDLSRLAQHDLELTKPALLFGTHTTLHTGNFAIASQITSRLTRLIMPLPMVIGLVFSCSEPHSRAELIATTSLVDSDLIPLGDAQAMAEAFRTCDPESTVPDVMLPIVNEWEETLDYIAKVVYSQLLDGYNTLMNPQFSLAQERGLLTVKSHTTELPPVTIGPTVGDSLRSEIDHDEYIELTFEEMERLIADPSRTALLDPWATEIARNLKLLPARDTARDAAFFGSTLLSKMPTVENASIADIVDLRSELEESLTRFRGAMVVAAEEFSNVDSVDASRFLELVRIRDIAPALADIEDEVRSNKYISELVRVVTSPRDMAVSAGTLAVAAASGGASVVQVAAAALGVGLPFARARLTQRDRGRAVERNRFFLLHRLRSEV